MIFATLQYTEHYEAMHDGILSFLESRFDHVEGGRQCDSWVWVGSGKTKVAIDTFSGMTHAVKSATSGSHVDKVIEVLGERYDLRIHSQPQKEDHEE